LAAKSGQRTAQARQAKSRPAGLCTVWTSMTSRRIRGALSRCDACRSAWMGVAEVACLYMRLVQLSCCRELLWCPGRLSQGLWCRTCRQAYTEYSPSSTAARFTLQLAGLKQRTRSPRMRTRSRHESSLLHVWISDGAVGTSLVSPVHSGASTGLWALCLAGPKNNQTNNLAITIDHGMLFARLTTTFAFTTRRKWVRWVG
jgi:hypothetical protein